MSQICHLTLLAKIKLSRKFPNLQYYKRFLKKNTCVKNFLASSVLIDSIWALMGEKCPGSGVALD